MRRRKLGAGLGVLWRWRWLAGCGGEEKEAAKQLQDTGTEILGDPAAVVALVDGEKITLSEVDLVTGLLAQRSAPGTPGVRSAQGGAAARPRQHHRHTCSAAKPGARASASRTRPSIR